MLYWEGTYALLGREITELLTILRSRRKDGAPQTFEKEESGPPPPPPEFKNEKKNPLVHVPEQEESSKRAPLTLGKSPPILEKIEETSLLASQDRPPPDFNNHAEVLCLITENKMRAQSSMQFNENKKAPRLDRREESSSTSW